MNGSRRRATLLALAASGLGTMLSAAAPVELAGRWRLNREQSQFPKEVGFDIAAPGDSAESKGSRGGGRGGGGDEPVGLFSSGALRQSEEDVQKVKELIADAKEPSPLLTITQTETAVTITDEANHKRTFHPNGKEEIVRFEAGPAGAVSRWVGQQLVVQVTVQKNRRFRYAYSRSPTGQLVVETRLEGGRSRSAGQVFRRVYDTE